MSRSCVPSPTAGSPSGPPRRDLSSSATAWPRSSICRRTRFALSRWRSAAASAARSSSSSRCWRCSRFGCAGRFDCRWCDPTSSWSGIRLRRPSSRSSWARDRMGRWSPSAPGTTTTTARRGWHAGLTANFLGGTYRIPSFDIRGLEVSTNKTPTDAYRAPGATQAYFALESALDELAAKLNMDPLELRLRNVSREGDATADGHRWPRIASTEVLEEARRHPVYTAPLGPGEAVGVALGAWGGARTPSAAGCRVYPDGTVSVMVSSPDISGAATGLAMIAAEAFGISPDMV